MSDTVTIPGVLEALAILVAAAPDTARGREPLSASEAVFLALRVATTINSFIEGRHLAQDQVGRATAAAVAAELGGD